MSNAGLIMKKGRSKHRMNCFLGIGFLMLRNRTGKQKNFILYFSFICPKQRHTGRICTSL